MIYNITWRSRLATSGSVSPLASGSGVDRSRKPVRGTHAPFVPSRLAKSRRAAASLSSIDPVLHGDLLKFVCMSRHVIAWHGTAGPGVVGCGRWEMCATCAMACAVCMLQVCPGMPASFSSSSCLCLSSSSLHALCARASSECHPHATYHRGGLS